MFSCYIPLQAVHRDVFYCIMQSSPSSSDELPALVAPPLWAAKRLAASLAESLVRHFAPGTETGRADRPEWMLQTVVRAVTCEGHLGSTLTWHDVQRGAFEVALACLPASPSPCLLSQSHTRTVRIIP